MADLADSIDDLICTFDSNIDYEMDTLAMFLFGWIITSLLVLWISKAIYNRFILKEEESKTKIIETKVVKSNSDTKDSSVKQLFSGSSSGGGSVGAGKAFSSLSNSSAFPQPPLRKRLSRKSPVPDFKKSQFYPAPQCTGADNIAVLWVNDVFQWLYNDLVIVNELLTEWLRSMNEFSKQTLEEHGIGIEFVRILPESPPPSLTNVFCECASNDDVTITCDCESTPAFQLKCWRQVAEKTEVSHYRVNVNRFRARLNIFCITEKLQANLKCDGWPEIKVLVAQVGNIKNSADETQLQDLISEMVINALRSTDTHFNLAQYPTCPRLIRHVGTPGPNRFSQYDMDPKFHSTPNTKSVESDKRLLVKVVKAAQLGVSDDPLEPFCIVEMDDPPQKNQTSIKKGTNTPFWDEHFLFDLSPNTAEILFEIFDHGVKPHKFLGLGIVGVEELLISPSQRQIISLQSRPYESDPVSGTLTVEFMFIEGADIPLTADRPFKLKETLRTVSPTGALITTTKTTFANGDTKMANGENLTDSALKELEISKLGTNPNKSTLIIHSVQRQPSQRLKVELVEGTWKPVLQSSPTDDKPQSQNTHLEPTSTNQSQNPEIVEPESTIEAPPRGRSRRKRDFFGTIKRRLNRSKTRSRSAGPGDEAYESENVARSISADRGVIEANENGARGRYHPADLENSRRSSLSEASGISGASTRTYVHEASTLVLEVIENGIKRHYLVPLSLAQKSRWRKKGVKLHIYSDHTFIAKHLSGGTVCQVCNKQLARRLGKQGYECRDCQMKCHKHCHVKVVNSCPTSTIHNIELSYITNPYTDKNIRML